MARLARIEAELPLRMMMARLLLVAEQTDREIRNRAWWRAHDERKAHAAQTL